MAKPGSLENPITSKTIGDDWGEKYCECDYCKMVALCTPDFDFYKQDDGTLKCQQCLVDACQAKGMIVTGFGPGRGRS